MADCTDDSDARILGHSHAGFLDLSDVHGWLTFEMVAAEIRDDVCDPPVRSVLTQEQSDLAAFSPARHPHAYEEGDVRMMM